MTVLHSLQASGLVGAALELAVAEAGYGAEWVRAPRLPLVGDERKVVLKLIRHGLRTRPTVSLAIESSED